MTSTQGERTRDALASLKIDRGRSAARPRRGWFWKILLWLVIVTGLVGGGLAIAARSGWLSGVGSVLAMPEALRPRPEVRTARVEVQRGRSGDATVKAAGYVESRRQAKIGARAPGRIQAVNVEEGSQVTAQQVLAVLEHADLDASLAAANASLARARASLGEHQIMVANYRKDYTRAEKLKQSASIAEVDFDRFKFQYDSAVAKIKSLEAEIALAEARVLEAEQLKENMFVRAPFDGTVISKDAEVGESILPGGMGEASGRGSVVTIADLHHLEVDCDVKEDFISRVHEGQLAEVAVDAVPDRAYAGRVRKIIPMGDRARATIKVKVEILEPDERLFPEMSGRVFFLPDQTDEPAPADRRRLLCPAQAIVSPSPPEERSPYVWLVNDQQRVQPRPVEIGGSRDDVVEITAGLDGSETVVVNPPPLRPGQLVKVADQ
jgi:RND family efflux transporter MFP subunit